MMIPLQKSDIIKEILSNSNKMELKNFPLYVLPKSMHLTRLHYLTKYVSPYLQSLIKSLEFFPISELPQTPDHREKISPLHYLLLDNNVVSISVKGTPFLFTVKPS